MRIAIIGGGIAGLAAAYELELAREQGAALEVVLFEGRERLGGSLASEVVGGAVLERGPDSFISEKTSAAELCRELGLGEALTPSNDADRKTFVVVRNRLVALPDGLMFLVPTKLVPTALSGLFTLGTKIRMALELFFPPRRHAQEDESVAELVGRHYGQGAVDRLADPLLSGIYGGDSTRLSAQTVLPRLVEMEREHGSLTRGMLAAHAKMRARMKFMPKGSSAKPAAPRGIFTTLKGGLQQMIDALSTRIRSVDVRLKTPVDALEKTHDGWRITTGGAVTNFDAVIVATPAWAASRVLESVDEELSGLLGAVPYSSSITVNLVYDEKQIGTLPPGFGFLVPATEGRALLACTFVHRKFLGRTPAGKAVLRAFLGGMRNEELLDADDLRLSQIVQRELGEILGRKVLPASARPEHVQVTRWRRAMAQYAVGHQKRKEAIDARVKALNTLRLAGNAYDGIGVPDCIRLGRQAARELVERQRC